MEAGSSRIGPTGPVAITPARQLGPEAIQACLVATARRDPLVVPVDSSEVLAQDAFAAVVDGEVVGVAWSRPVGRAREVEARVLPGNRRRGVGSALLQHLSGADDELVCACDAGHPTTRRFIEHRGFRLLGVQFFQRWDGTPDDVPRFFPSCTLRTPADRAATFALLHEAHGEAWPPLVVDSPERLPVGSWLREACIDGEPVGALVAWAADDAWTVAGLAVRAGFRGRGVGRALCCELMRHAAQAGLGVALRVHHANQAQQAWTAGLGFWTYRTWATYRRAPRPLA